MILYEMLQNVNTEIINHIDKRAEQLDGTYLISKSEEKMDYVIDFFACYKTKTTYIPVSYNISEEIVGEIVDKAKFLTDDIFGVWATSGTTGKNKMATHTYSSVEWSVLNSIKEWEYTKDDYVYCCELPNCTAFFMFTIPTLLVGCDVVFEKFNISTINKYDFNFVPLTPKMIEMLDGTEKLNGAKTSIGGDITTTSHVNKFKSQGGGDYWHSYSCTESLMPLLTIKNKIDGLLPHPDYEVKLNSKGELLVKGPGVFQGYLGEPKLNTEWYNTGDIFEEVDGGYNFISRAREMVYHL